MDKWAQRGLVAALAVAVLAGSTIGIILATKTADPALATQEVARTSATTRSQPPSAAISRHHVHEVAGSVDHDFQFTYAAAASAAAASSSSSSSSATGTGGRALHHELR